MPGNIAAHGENILWPGELFYNKGLDCKKTKPNWKNPKSEQILWYMIVECVRWLTQNFKLK